MQRLTETQQELIQVMKSRGICRETIVCTMMLLKTDNGQKQMLRYLNENVIMGAEAEEPILQTAMKIAKSAEE